MSVLDLLRHVKCDTGTIAEEFDCDVLTMRAGGWDRHRPGIVSVPMIAFEGPGNVWIGPRRGPHDASIEEANVGLAEVIEDGMVEAFGLIPSSGRVGTLYVRQDWISDEYNGRHGTWGRFGCVLRIGP